jgi:hypothetical protein
MVPPGASRGRADFDPSSYLVGFDNVLHLWFESDAQRSEPWFRVLKSIGNDYVHEPISIEFRRA